MGGGETLAAYVWDCCRECNGQACITKAAKNRKNRGNALNTKSTTPLVQMALIQK